MNGRQHPPVALIVVAAFAIAVAGGVLHSHELAVSRAGHEQGGCLACVFQQIPVEPCPAPAPLEAPAVWAPGPQACLVPALLDASRSTQHPSVSATVFVPHDEPTAVPPDGTGVRVPVTVRPSGEAPLHRVR